MAVFSIKQCAFCGCDYTPKASIDRHCSIECRVLDIAAKFNGVDGCWPWPLSANVQTGYGQLSSSVDGKRTIAYAHRLSFSIFKSPIPDGFNICHTCDNRRCFNPAHLFAGTQKDNVADMIAKGRLPSRVGLQAGDRHWSRVKPELIHRGEKRPQSPLCEDDVRFIRASSEKGIKLAEMFNISASAISAIRHRKTWQHVK